jgi:GDP-L-fucose synthase
MDQSKLNFFFDNKNILITGGTGLIGRFVVSKLCDLNAKVTVVSLDDLLLE